MNQDRLPNIYAESLHIAMHTKGAHIGDIKIGEPSNKIGQSCVHDVFGGIGTFLEDGDEEGLDGEGLTHRSSHIYRSFTKSPELLTGIPLI